jgi:hypothetical protein
MSYFFAFESDMERSLRYIPMAVRLKLDKCGVKLSLAQWNALPESERSALLQLPCESAAETVDYCQTLCRLVKEVTGDDPRLISVNPLWDGAEIPDQIADKAMQLGIKTPSSVQWRDLTALQRYALVKLTRAAHDNRNFIPALHEFGLL